MKVERRGGFLRTIEEDKDGAISSGDEADDGATEVDNTFRFEDEDVLLLPRAGWGTAGQSKQMKVEAVPLGKRGRKDFKEDSSDEEEEDEEDGDEEDGEGGEDRAVESEDEGEDIENEEDDSEQGIEEQEGDEEPAPITDQDEVPQNDEEDDDAGVDDEEEEGTPQTFPDLRLSKALLKACTALNYEKPTPIQRRCIPVVLAGKDVCGSAHTGSGKTAAFMLPVLERLLYRPKRIPICRVLVLTPTRELAAQCHAMTEQLAQFSDIRSCLVVGGLSNKTQEAALRARPDIIVATPGRMIDHLRNAQSITLEGVEVLILDEADRLLDMGFTEEVKEIVKSCPKGRQTLLFSATMSRKVMQLASISLKEPTYISVNKQLTVASGLRQEFIRIKEANEGDREAMLIALCQKTYKKQAIVFVRSKRYAHHLRILFGLFGIKASELHGNLTQLGRLEALEDFRDGRVGFLIATDLASRGLDIEGIQTVINFNMPRSHAQYVHRVGRTARAGHIGSACSFLSEDDRPLLKEIINKAIGTNVNQRKLPTATIERLRDQIHSFQADIERVMEQERDEKAIGRAEREMKKLENIVEHQKEIQSRPKRTWFQSEKEKSDAAKRSKIAMFGEEVVENASSKQVEGDEPEEFLSKRQFMRKIRKEQEVKKSQRVQDNKKKKRKELREQAEAPAILKGVKASKASNKPVKLNTVMSHGKKNATSSSTSGKPPRKKKKTNVFSPGSKDASSKGPSKEFNSGSFKSKKKYKRR